MSRNTIGRAFRITEKDIKSYDRVAKPRMRANPMGVTTLAMVNGRGAYASARSGAKGQTRAQRLARARKLIGGKSMQSNARGHRAAFIKAMRKNSKPARKAGGSSATDQRRRGKRVAAYKAALKRNKSKTAAARSALRAVPFTSNERKRKAKFAGVQARYRRNDFVGVGKSEWGTPAKTPRKPSQPRTQRQPTRKQYQPPPPKKKARKGKNVAKAKRKTKKKATGRVSPAVGTSGAKRRKGGRKRVYQRAKLYNPRTGRSEYSYMYRAAGGRLRRIPTSAIIGGGKGLKGFNPKLADKVRKSRERAAARILKQGGVFVPNKARKRRKSKAKAGQKAYWARYRAARKAGYTARQARAIGKGTSKAGTKKRRKSAKKRRKAAAPRKRRKSTAKRRRKAAAPRKRRKSAKKRRKTTAPRKRRKSTKKRRKASRAKGRKRGKARRLTKGRYYVANRRRRRRSGRRRMRRNAFMANLKSVLASGALVAVGYLTHRVMTSLVCEYVFTPYVVAPEGKEPNMTLKTWERPICGAVVGLVGVGALSMMTDKNVIKGDTAMKIGGGMVASLFQFVVVSALSAANQTSAASYLSGYSNSTAYSLRGNRRRRGIGNMQSIMPRYAPIGAYEQAAAGMGEYFTGAGAFEQAAAGVGEYFVPRGTSGVGAYEPAGPLALQASANGVGQIEDGIRPDSNLDRVLDLAESAAGLGEYITATPDNGGWSEGRVPTQSQWIPNGPLWAGELKVKDSQTTSELPAGVLATVGGNGILSG